MFYEISEKLIAAWKRYEISIQTDPKFYIVKNVLSSTSIRMKLGEHHLAKNQKSNDWKQFFYCESSIIAEEYNSL